MPDGHPLRPDDPAELGGHRLLRRLGEGNQGVVYLGRTPSGEHVAIKLLHARMAGDPGARDRFVRELSAAKKVARFCTAQVLDADLAGDHPYIVSEYVKGRSLRSHILAEGPRTAGALERLAIGTLTALAAIHKAGIVHRDFNPHNVLLGPDGPRVIDFGIARALGAACNNETNSVGTPSYMAPEQVSGDEIGPPADMFAWGSTILFAGTGRPPFGNDSVHAVMERILHDEPDASALPEPLRSVIAACLNKDPDQRPTAQRAQAGLLGEEATGTLMPPPAFGAATGPSAEPSDGIGTDISTDDSAGTDAGTEVSIPAVTHVDFHSPVTPPLPVRVPESPATQPPPVRAFAEPRTPGAPGPAALGVSVASGPAGGPRPSGSMLTPAPLPATPAPAGEGWRRHRLGWALLAGAVVVVAGAAVAVPLWQNGGEAATAPKARAAAVPPTPAIPPASPSRTPVTQEPQLNGVRSGIPRRPKPTKRPHKGCRDYQHAYTMIGTGSVLLKVSVCRDAYHGDAVLGDTVSGDGWDVCLQLRGHLVGPGNLFVSTILSSRDGRVHAFDNGPRVRFGPRTTRTEDRVVVNVGKCKGSGSTIQTSWQTREQLAAG